MGLQSDTLGSSLAVASFFFSSPFSLSRLSSNETSIIHTYLQYNNTNTIYTLNYFGTGYTELNGLYRDLKVNVSMLEHSSPHTLFLFGCFITALILISIDAGFLLGISLHLIHLIEF